MFFAPDPDVVLDDLGEKVVHGLSRAVRLSRRDLAEYRSVFPGWVADATERGLANWIHDRIWSHLLVQVEGVADVSIRDEEPTREMFVGTTYRLRVKRHQADGMVSSYPTPTALDFFGQGGTMPIPTLEEVNLIAGYEWDREERAIGAPLLSLRNGQSNVLWVIELPEVDDGHSGGTVVRPVAPGPKGPIVELPGIDLRRNGSKDRDSE